ncbi:MAG: hypothetical protein R2939_19045 [Kofleriaceae bacterium]
MHLDVAARVSAALMLVAGLAACGSSVSRQEGTVMAPRPLTYDGEPIGKGTRVTVLAGSAGGTGKPELTNDATAIARLDGEVSMYKATSPRRDVGVALGLGAAPGSRFLGGASADGAPTSPTVSVAAGGRHAMPLGPRWTVGLAAEVGLLSSPVHVDGSTTRGLSLLARGALVPRLALGSFALYGSLGVATEPHIPATFSAVSDDVRVETGLAITLGGGVSARLSDRIALGAGAAFSGGANASYPSASLRLLIDLDDGAGATQAAATPGGPPGVTTPM